MEDKGFLDFNPQFGQGGEAQQKALNSTLGPGGVERLFDPGLGEWGQFQRENYFVDKENAFNEYMFNKANEYNSATAQMERAKEAGINPNLMAAGIAGMGGNQATPMQGARGDTGMSNNTFNPVEMMAGIANTMDTLTSAGETAGNLFGFGEKNKAEINLIKENAVKAAEEAKFTRRQRIQLQAIGQTLIDNAKLEGKQIEANINNLHKLNDVYEQQKYNIAADTNLKEAQTGTEYENQKSMWYDNMRKEYEKEFRDMFGAELTHDKLQFLVEACMNGHGETIVKYFTDTMAGVIKGIKDQVTHAFKLPKLKPRATPEEIHDRKNTKAMEGQAKRIWVNNIKIRQEYKGDYEGFLKDFKETHKNDTLYKPMPRQRGYFGDLK